MASVHSMEIRGIRSFGADDCDIEKIKFLSPITCIVGQNGCGKTTIIESLRYATTGLPPPGTDKGKSFVYDPTLSRSGESIGQVKLRFTTAKKTLMQIKRTLRCNVNARTGKLEMKTLEPTLEYKDKHGELHAISGRCQDINTMIYDNMGVTQPILDNVIFCHQEDSNWPLDEPKKLKEKFDDIFDAAKYNKSSELLTKAIKARTVDLKHAKDGLTHYKQFWEIAKKKKQELDRESTRFESGVEELQSLREKKGPMEKELSEIHHRESHYSDLNTKISTLKSSKENLINQQDHLKKEIKNLHYGSKSALEKEIKSFEANVKDKEKQIYALEEEISKLSNDHKNISTRIQKEQMELGRLTQEEKSHQETLRKRLDLLKSIAKELDKDISVSDPQDKKGTEKALALLDRSVQDFDSNYKSIVDEQEQVEKTLESEIYKCRDDLSKAKDRVTQLKNQLEEIRGNLRSSTEDLKKVDVGLSKVSILENRLERVQKELKAEEDLFDIQESQQQILNTQGERKDYEDELTVIAKEINKLQLAKGYTAEADVYKKSIGEKNSSINALMSKHIKSLKEIFKEIPESNSKNAVDDVIKKNEREKDRLQKTLQDAKDSQYSSKTEMKYQLNLLKESENKLKDLKNKINKECGDRELDSVLAETEAELQKTQDLKGELDSSCVLFKRYMAQLSKDDPCCPLCHRDFAEQTETLKLIDELTLKVNEYPAKVKECAETQKKLQQKQSRLQQLIPSQKKIEELQDTEIPQIKDQIEETEMTLQVALAEEKAATDSLKGPEGNLKVAEAVKSDMAFVDKYREELKSLETKLKDVEAKLPTTGASRSLEEAQEDQERVRTHIQKLQKAAEDKQLALNNHQKKLNDMKDKKNSLAGELLEIKAGEQRKTQLLEQVKQLTEKEKQIDADLEKAKLAVAPKSESLQLAEEEKSKAKAEHSRVREKQTKLLTNFKSRLANLKDLSKTVENFEAKNISHKLEVLKANVEKITSEREDIEREREEISSKTTGLQKDLASQNVKQRDLNDNMRFLELGEKVEETDAKLKKLKDELGDLNYIDLMDQKKKLNTGILNIMNEMSRLEGSQKELKTKIKELEQELNRDNMKNAEPKYKEEHVKVVVEARIIQDMQIYLQTLRKSVILFHQERMEEVNRIIRELWVSIYKGSDIDHVEIKTEADEKQLANMRQNYNYRVVMVKKDKELDMRGRCSAGQKMLASLVIRIALAETFSSKCGILALDEPTTNLDSTNIESLGDSLIQLVQSHRLQKNFQLLIITHDEDFIEKMNQAQLIDSFYKVSRDVHGHSKIKKFLVDGTAVQAPEK